MVALVSCGPLSPSRAHIEWIASGAHRNWRRPASRCHQQQRRSPHGSIITRQAQAADAIASSSSLAVRRRGVLTYRHRRHARRAARRSGGSVSRPHRARHRSQRRRRGSPSPLNSAAEASWPSTHFGRRDAADRQPTPILLTTGSLHQHGRDGRRCEVAQ